MRAKCPSCFVKETPSTVHVSKPDCPTCGGTGSVYAFLGGGLRPLKPVILINKPIKILGTFDLQNGDVLCLSAKESGRPYWIQYRRSEEHPLEWSLKLINPRVFISDVELQILLEQS